LSKLFQILISLNPPTFEQYREEYALKKFHHCIKLTPQFLSMYLKLKECIVSVK